MTGQKMDSREQCIVDYCEWQHADLAERIVDLELAITQKQIDWYDGGYAEGYSAGYSRAIEETQSYLYDEGYKEAADALTYLFSPEGIAEQNRKIKELYGSLRKLAEESRNIR